VAVAGGCGAGVAVSSLVGLGSGEDDSAGIGVATLGIGSVEGGEQAKLRPTHTNPRTVLLFTGIEGGTVSPSDA
jgi:hypothetical protein